MAEAHARKCSGDSSQCRNSDEQIGRTCEYKHAVAVYFCRECAEERNQSLRKLSAGRITCLVPRSQPPERRPAALAARPRGPGG